MQWCKRNIIILNKYITDQNLLYIKSIPDTRGFILISPNQSKLKPFVRGSWIKKKKKKKKVLTTNNSPPCNHKHTIGKKENSQLHASRAKGGPIQRQWNYYPDQPVSKTPVLSDQLRAHWQKPKAISHSCPSLKPISPDPDNSRSQCNAREPSPCLLSKSFPIHLPLNTLPIDIILSLDHDKILVLLVRASFFTGKTGGQSSVLDQLDEPSRKPKLSVRPVISTVRANKWRNGHPNQIWVFAITWR